MRTSNTSHLSKTPSAKRSFLGIVAFIFLLQLLPSELLAQEVLNEEQVIQLARTGTPNSVEAKAADKLAQVKAQTAGLYMNPSISWDRETVETSTSLRQDILRATLPIQIAQPLTTRSLAASESAWTRASTSHALSGAILEILLLYYQIVLLEQQLGVLNQSVVNLEEAARVLERREAEGNASGYESTRLVVARELVQSRQSQVDGELQGTRARFAALAGLPSASFQVPPTLKLQPEGIDARSVKAQHGEEGSTPSIRLALESARYAQEASDRAEWVWLPTLQLGAGMKYVNEFGGAYGYVLGVSLELPIFDHGQALRKEAAANHALAKARASTLQRSTSAEVQESLAIYRNARAELERFEAKTMGPVEALLAASTSGYREGERTILELLDAQNARTEVAERQIRLLGNAKEAEARLRAAQGEFQ